MAMVPTGQTYNWYFDGASQITNISYNGIVYGFRVKYAHCTLHNNPMYNGKVQHLNTHIMFLTHLLFICLTQEESKKKKIFTAVVV